MGHVERNAADMEGILGASYGILVFTLHRWWFNGGLMG
jgi:hypothetical protein